MDYDIYDAIGGLFALGYTMFLAVLGIVIYLVSAFLYYRLYKYLGGWYADNAWMAFVPFASNYICGKFFQEQLNLPEWNRYIFGFSGCFSFIPIIGSLASFAGGIYTIVYQIKFMSNNNAPGIHYVAYFLFSIIMPHLWMKELQSNPPADNMYFNTKL